MSCYEESLNAYSRLDLCQIGDVYEIDWERISNPDRETLEGLGVYEEDNCVIDYETVELENLWSVAEYLESDGDERRYALEQLLKPASHYLVMAHNCRWNVVCRLTRR